MLPTRDNCDPGNPSEAFLWMFVGMPDDLHLPMSYFRHVSQRFWDLGARPVEEPVKVLVPPGEMQQSAVNPGYWERIDGQEPEDRPKSSITGIPTRQSCNLSNPEEAFLWMFVALPYVRGGAMILSEAAYRRDSEHLWDLGARPVEEPTLEYVPSSMAQPDWATSAGKWVPVGTFSAQERERLEVESSIARLHLNQKAELYAALEAWESGRELPDTKAGLVVRNMLNSEPQLVPLALTVLRELHDAA